MAERKKLQNRIQYAMGNEGIAIYPDQNAGGKYEVFFGTFRLSYPESALQDPFNDHPELHNVNMRMLPTKYWDARQQVTTRIQQSHTFVLVVETCDGKIVDSCRLYYPENTEKYDLKITTESKPRYGKNAYMITVEWPEDCEPEEIGTQYIYLIDNNGVKYPFLTDVIRAKDGRRQIAQFVYEVPDGRSPGEFRVEADPLLGQKYEIEISKS